MSNDEQIVRRHRELTGSLVFDEEKLQAFLKRVLVHIELDLDSGKIEGQKERKGIMKYMEMHVWG